MRRVRYGVGMSLDEFIADSRDDTAWMIGDPAYDSKPFFASIDTVLVGRRSYEVMLRHRTAASGKDIWLCGGGDLFRSLLDANLVDTIEVGVCPIVLGEGRPFLPSSAQSHRLTLTHQESFPSGLLVLHYDVDDVSRG